MFESADYVWFCRSLDVDTSPIAEHVGLLVIYQNAYHTNMARMMAMRPNPVRELLHQQMGIDSFALDGTEARIHEGWEERPHNWRHNVRRL